MSKRNRHESLVIVGPEGGYRSGIPLTTQYSDHKQAGDTDPSVDIVQVVGGPGVSGSAIGYPEIPTAAEHYYSTAIPMEGAVYLGGKEVDVAANRKAIIHEMGFDILASIPFGIIEALHSDGIKLLQPSSFGAATYLAGNMYANRSHAKIDGIVFRSPYFMTPDEGLHQVNNAEVIASSGVRLKMLAKLIPESALSSRRDFMEALAECYYEAKEQDDQRTMAEIALGLVGHQLKVGEAIHPDNLPARAQKLMVGLDRIYKTDRPEKVLSMIKSLTGADAYLGAELLFRFERQNADILGSHDSTLELLNNDREQIRKAIGDTALGRVIILSGQKDMLTPAHIGARQFKESIGGDMVELRSVPDAGHPGYDKNMRKALRATMKEVVDKIMKQKGLV